MEIPMETFQRFHHSLLKEKPQADWEAVKPALLGARKGEMEMRVARQDHLHLKRAPPVSPGSWCLSVFHRIIGRGR